MFCSRRAVSLPELDSLHQVLRDVTSYKGSFLPFIFAIPQSSLPLRIRSEDGLLKTVEKAIEVHHRVGCLCPRWRRERVVSESRHVWSQNMSQNMYTPRARVFSEASVAASGC